MTYKVTFSSGYNYSIKKAKAEDYKANLVSKIEIMPQNLDELTDVEISGNNDKYVLMYDAASGKWKDRNPDEVLSAATTEPIQPGLPADFENQLDIDLDDRIDLDAGSF
jgi:hypothetical protein